MTLEHLITTTQCTMTVKAADHNPSMRDSTMDHWRCTLRNGVTGVRCHVYFSLGIGHQGRQPDLAEVLECLASDASSADEPFEVWCREYGYDEDSRSAERTYKAVHKSTAKLKALMGPHYETLLYETERL